jgi:hypothetical protein
VPAPVTPTAHARSGTFRLAGARQCHAGQHAPSWLRRDLDVYLKCQVRQDDPRRQWAYFGAAAAGWIFGLAG